MSLADNKRNVFTTIGAYNSLMHEGKQAQQTDLYSSINNKSDIVPFLLDVLKTVAGSEALKEVIGGMFSNLIDEVEPKLKTALKKQFVLPNASEPLPTSFVTDGISVPVKSIDSSGIFKNNPNSETGNLIYGSTTNFNTRAYDAINNSGTFVGFSNMQMKYDSSTDNMQIKPSGSTGTISDYFTNYIDSVNLLDKKTLLSNVMDSFYGTLAKIQNKSAEQIYGELQTEALLGQLLEEDNDSFVISPEKYDELQEKAREMAEGIVNYDLGCGLMPAELGINDFSKIVSTITGSTDPFYIGNQLGSTIDKSTTGSTEAQDMTTENKETMKDSFFQRIIRIFTIKMLEAVTTTPQIRVLFGMMSFLQNGTVDLNTPTDDMKKIKVCIKCMSKEIMQMIAKFIFALAIAYLIKLLKPIIKKVIKEKINQYTGILISLTGVNKLTDALT